MRRSALLVLIALAFMLGCKRAAPAPAASAPPPSGLVPINQQFEFADGSVTHQGTGFLARTPGGRIVCVTSAHFLEQNGPRLRRVVLAMRQTSTPVGVCTSSLGRPGHAPLDDDKADRRADYLILMPEGKTAGTQAKAAVLDLETRETIPKGERVWFPFCDYQRNLPQEWVAGTVIEGGSSYAVVRLERTVTLTCESGSPIVSQKTGLVLGTLSAGGESRGGTVLWLAPAHAIRAAMAKAESANTPVRLQDGVGK